MFDMTSLSQLIRSTHVGAQANDFLFAIWFVILFFSRSSPNRLLDIDIGVVGDTFSTRSAPADDCVALQRSVGHLGAVHLLAGALHRMVPVRVEVLQGQKRQQLHQQQSTQLKLSMRH